MAYTITPADLASITDAEMAFGTVRLLPEWEDIPAAFRVGNLYTQLAEALFFGQPLPQVKMDFREGFLPEHLNRAVRAHLTSFQPRHEVKMAGVGFLIAQCAELVPDR